CRSELIRGRTLRLRVLFSSVVERFDSASSVLRERVVRIAVEPALAWFGRCNDRMGCGFGVLGRVAVGRVVAAMRAAGRLVRAEMNRVAADLHALIADMLLRVLDVGDRADVCAGV